MTLWVPDVVVGPLRVETFKLVGLTPFRTRARSEERRTK